MANQSRPIGRPGLRTVPATRRTLLLLVRSVLHLLDGEAVVPNFGRRLGG